MRKSSVAILVMFLALGGSSACATKKFVKTNVDGVNQKVDSLGRTVEETQERTRKNEGRITEVDQKAQAADQKAQAAAQSAQAANSAAVQANSAAAAAAGKADALDKAAKRLVYEVVLSEDQGNFESGKTALPEDAKARIDQLISQLKQDPKGAYFEIEGHTDNVGPKEYNDQIGLERAESVKRYLYEKHQIPLHKMNVISYGPDKPIAPNKTRADRARNRRVVIRVLA